LRDYWDLSRTCWKKYQYGLLLLKLMGIDDHVQSLIDRIEKLLREQKETTLKIDR
jgi:hypothetical protein